MLRLGLFLQIGGPVDRGFHYVPASTAFQLFWWLASFDPFVIYDLRLIISLLDVYNTWDWVLCQGKKGKN